MQLAKRSIFNGYASADCLVGIIAGPQACGKTTVAAAIAHDSDTQSRYSDGVAWVHCGPAATPEAVLRQLLELVRSVQDAGSGQAAPFFVNIAQCASHPNVRSAMRAS